MSQNEKEEQKNIFEGTIAVISRGIGFLPTDTFEEDIEIQEGFLNTALHGDTVRVALRPIKKGERVQGEVISVEKRARYEFVGTLHRTDRVCFLMPDNRRAYRDFFIANPPDNAADGHKAVVRFVKWDDPKKNPEAEIVTVLGPSGEHEVEMNSIVKEKGFETTYPPKVEKEAEEQRENHLPIRLDEEDRTDMRDRTTFTIDAASAKDFDDALSIKELSDGQWEVGIHIADVSHYVSEGSELDKEARKRGTSVYLVDRTIPMLPEILSNDLCSLNPKEEKRAFSAVFTVDASGEVKESWFGKTLVISDERFTYEDAQERIESNTGSYAKEIRLLNDIAKELRKKKFSKGAIDFETNEVGFELDADGTPTRIFIKERFDAHKLIEEFMLLANREVAHFLYKGQEKNGGKRSGVIYRVHEKPDPEKLENLIIYMKALGHEINIDPEDLAPEDLNTILHKVTGESEETLVKTAAIRSMSKAVYSTKNKGHFGLAFDYYTHFTSPIRRYPDLIVHRLISKQLKDKHISPEEIQRLEAVATESTEREILAAEAERESIKLKQVEFMEKHKGDVFDAVVSGVTSWGVYVEEKTTLSSGMIHVSKLGDDYFEYDEESFALVGKKTGTRYALGDELKVTLTDANTEERQLTFEPAN